MAISGGDGSIILTTQIDETGLKKGFSSIKNNVKDMSNNFAKLGGIIAAAFSLRAIIQFSSEASKLSSTTEASVQRLIDIYGKASTAVGNFIDQNAHALGLSRAAATEFSAVYGNLFSVWADQETNAKLTAQYLNATAVVASKTGRTMQDVQERIRSGLLGNTEAVEDLGIFVNVKTIEMTEAFQRVAKGAKWDSLTAAQQSQVRTLAILEQATKKYGAEVANTTSLTRARYNAAFQDFQNTWGQVVNIILMPILRIATRIFNTLTAGLQALAGISKKTIQTQKKFSNENEISQIAPSNDDNKIDEKKEIENEEKAIRKKIKALQKETAEEKKLESEIDNLRKKLKELRKETAEEKAADVEAQKIEENIQNLKDQNKQIRKNAKEKEEANQKEFASFDTIETLNFKQQTEEEKALEANEEQIDALQEQLDLVNEKKDALRETRDLEIDGIEEQIDARQESLDLIRETRNAEIETLRDQIDLLEEKKDALENINATLSENSNLDTTFDIGNNGGSEINEDEFTEKLALIGMVTGWALVGLGIILMFSGHPFLGIGMVASGFVLSAGAGEGGKELGEEEKNKLIKIGEVVGVALIGLGVLLLFTPFWQVGLGMVASGATAIYTALALGEFSQDIKKKVTNILFITGTVLLVLGTILLFVPGAELFGIAMLAAGAAELITAAILNADKIKQWISENLWVLVAEAGKFLFVIGIMLLFVPGMMNWGLAAMIAGLSIVGISAIVPNWNEIKTTISDFFNDNWEAISTVSTVLVIIGIILCFAQQWLIGIGLIATGAVSLYGAVSPNWDELKNKISEFFSDNWGAISIVSSALIVLGILLCVTQQWLYGLSLIGLGAVGLYEAISPNWDELKNKISEFFADNQTLFVGVGLALVVLGIILLFSGVGIPLGLGVLTSGALIAWEGLSIEPNWESIKETISNVFTDISDWVKTWGLLVLGIILTISGVGISLGLSLMKQGGANLTEAQDPLWNTIVDKVKEVWEDVKNFWNRNIAKYFTGSYWKSLGETMMNGLTGAFTSAIDKIKNMFSNLMSSLTTSLNIGGFGSSFSSFSGISNFSVPGLAKGAVIPPNREFMAILGDNKRENEIVSPVSTMKQAFTEAMIEMGGNFGGRNTEVILEIDGREFGRAVLEQGEKENRRIGARLVTV